LGSVSRSVGLFVIDGVVYRAPFGSPHPPPAGGSRSTTSRATPPGMRSRDAVGTSAAEWDGGRGTQQPRSPPPRRSQWPTARIGRGVGAGGRRPPSVPRQSSRKADVKQTANPEPRARPWFTAVLGASADRRRRRRLLAPTSEELSASVAGGATSRGVLLGRRLSFPKGMTARSV